MQRSVLVKALLGLLLLIGLPPLAVAVAPPSVLVLQAIPEEGLLLNKGWTYRAGDDPRWAQNTAADQLWQPIDPTLCYEKLPQVQQSSIGWLRLRFRVGPGLQHQPLVMSLQQYAASEVYLNGQLVRRYGAVSASAASVQPYYPDTDAIVIPTHSLEEQVLALRISPWPPVPGLNHLLVPALLEARVFGVTGALQSFKQEAFFKTSDMLLFGAFLLISLLHLAYYTYDSSQKANIYFAFYTLLTAGSFGITGFLDEIQRLELRLVADVLSLVCLQTGSVLAVRALYTLFKVRIGPIYYGLCAANVISIVLMVVGHRMTFYPTVAFMLLVTAEQLRLTLGALRRTKRAAGIIATGFGVALALLLVFGYLANFQSQVLRLEILSIPLHTLLTFPAFLSPMLAISLFLTRRFALNSRLLAIKLEQVNRLSARSLAQQQEKQQLLAEQNETLERLVQKRTAALQQTLSNLQNAQQQLVQKEKMASLGELTAGIAHEIQNPLNFINNFAEVAEELLAELKEGPLRELPEQHKPAAEALVNELTQDLVKITCHGHRADSIVKSMLEHTRTHSHEPQLTDLNALADEYLRLAYHGLRAKDKTFNASFSTDFDPALEPVPVVGQDIGRVLLNLFNNAFYAVHERYKLGQADYRPTVCVSTRCAASGEVEIRVRDNGLGVPKAVQQKIFQPFFTTKPTGEGTGLGLSLSYEIITKGHNGTIQLDTREGEFTEFTVSLPVTASKLQAEAMSV